jgi:glycosyltransferase involved in cell wall biosynthesis
MRGVSDWSFLSRIVPFIEVICKSWKPDVIHAHTEFAGAAVVKVAKACNIPSVITVHGVNISSKLYKNRKHFHLIKDSLNNADRVILVGESLIDHFSKVADSTDHFRIVYNGFRVPTINRNSEKICRNNKIQFISVSNLHEGKGVDLNIRAFERLNSMGIKDWHYTIVGSGRERSNLESLCKHLGLDNHVEFIGAVKHDAVYFHLNNSDVFVLPSYREAFGIAYVEAMAMGLLTIGVKGQGPSAFIADNLTGFLVDPRSLDSLTERLLGVFRNREKMQVIATAGRKHILSKFTWDAHARQLLAVYNELTAA